MRSLLAHPALWLTLTLAAYLLGLALHRRCKSSAWCHPLLIAVAVLVPALWLTGLPYADYAAAVRPIHLLLAPATVALAVPLYTHLGHMRRMLRPLLLALTLGGLTGIASALAFGQLFGLPPGVLLSFAPKSVTTPLAMALAEQLGGNTSLAAAAVIVTGIVGALFAPWLMRGLRVRDETIEGFALGLASHGVGTTRALHISHKAGAFAGLAMSLNGLFTSLILPLLMLLWPL